MIPRAAAEAALALLLGGTLATRGWAGLLRAWDWLVPYLAFFLALELVLRRRAGGAARVLTLGAAFALLFEGVYRKSLLNGLGPLGVDAGALAAACLDWGMLAVMASHLVSRRRPRREAEPSRLGGVPAAAALAALGACMAAVYLVKTRFGHYVAERMVGPTWLLTDVLFALGAWTLHRRAVERDPAEPPPWHYALCAYAVWAPAAQVLAAWGREFSWPGALTFMLGAAWTAGCGWGFWRLWRWRGAVDETPVRDSRTVLYAAAWRVAGSAAVLAAYHPAVFDERAAAAYAVLVDVPSRLAFSYAYLTARLDV